MAKVLTRAFWRLKAKLRTSWIAALAPKGRASTRYLLSSRYLRGKGIEIGALHTPLRVPWGAQVRYVDRLSVAELRNHYPEVANMPLVVPDILDDGESLSSLGDESQDFVIANHFLEHCQDPIGALENMLRVLRAGGCLYLAIPDKRYIFDKDRPVTTFEHLLEDHQRGPGTSRREHYEEFVRFVYGVTNEEELSRVVENQMSMGYSIHFHVWSMKDILKLMASVGGVIGYAFDVEAVLRNAEEVICILRRAEERR